MSERGECVRLRSFHCIRFGLFHIFKETEVDSIFVSFFQPLHKIDQARIHLLRLLDRRFWHYSQKFFIVNHVRLRLGMVPTTHRVSNGSSGVKEGMCEVTMIPVKRRLQHKNPNSHVVCLALQFFFVLGFHRGQFAFHLFNQPLFFLGNFIRNRFEKARLFNLKNPFLDEYRNQRDNYASN